MPLVIPGITSAATGIEEWQNKLVGKKLSDSESSVTTFSKKDLPKEHRLIEPNSVHTADFRQDRLNVHVSADGTVSKVVYG